MIAENIIYILTIYFFFLLFNDFRFCSFVNMILYILLVGASSLITFLITAGLRLPQFAINWTFVGSLSVLCIIFSLGGIRIWIKRIKEVKNNKDIKRYNEKKLLEEKERMNAKRIIESQIYKNDDFINRK